MVTVIILPNVGDGGKGRGGRRCQNRRYGVRLWGLKNLLLYITFCLGTKEKEKKREGVKLTTKTELNAWIDDERNRLLIFSIKTSQLHGAQTLQLKTNTDENCKFIHLKTYFVWCFTAYCFIFGVQKLCFYFQST